MIESAGQQHGEQVLSGLLEETENSPSFAASAGEETGIFCWFFAKLTLFYVDYAPGRKCGSVKERKDLIGAV